MECYDWMVRLRNWNITFLNWLIRMLSFFFEPCNDNDTNEKRPQRRFTDLSIDVVVHGDVGVRDVNLHVEIRDVLDPRVVAVPHQRLHGNDCVNWNEILLKILLKSRKSRKSWWKQIWRVVEIGHFLPSALRQKSYWLVA